MSTLLKNLCLKRSPKAASEVETQGRKKWRGKQYIKQCRILLDNTLRPMIKTEMIYFNSKHVFLNDITKNVVLIEGFNLLPLAIN